MLGYIIIAVVALLLIIASWFGGVAYRKNIAEAKVGKAEERQRIL